MAYQELSTLGYSIIANVMCGEKSGVLIHKGDLSSLASGDTSGLLVRCRSPCCASKPLLLSSREGAIFTPNGFESHSGMSHRKKWRDTLRVMGPGKASETLGRWLARQVPGLEQHPVSEPGEGPSSTVERQAIQSGQLPPEREFEDAPPPRSWFSAPSAFTPLQGHYVDPNEGTKGELLPAAPRPVETQAVIQELLGLLGASLQPCLPDEGAARGGQSAAAFRAECTTDQVLTNLVGRVEALEQACKSCHHVIQVLLSSNLELSRRLESLEGPRVATDTTSQTMQLLSSLKRGRPQT